MMYFYSKNGGFSLVTSILRNLIINFENSDNYIQLPVNASVSTSLNTSNNLKTSFNFKNVVVGKCKSALDLGFLDSLHKCFF